MVTDCNAQRAQPLWIRNNVRAQPSREPTHLCVPAASTDASLRLFARRRSSGRRRFSPTGLPAREPGFGRPEYERGTGLVIRVVIRMVIHMVIRMGIRMVILYGYGVASGVFSVHTRALVRHHNLFLCLLFVTLTLVGLF